MTDKEITKLKAQLETTKAALAAAIQNAEWQSRTNRELNALSAKINRLQNAMHLTINENPHLADGEDCTLIHLKRALAT